MLNPFPTVLSFLASSIVASYTCCPDVIFSPTITVPCHTCFFLLTLWAYPCPALLMKSQHPLPIITPQSLSLFPVSLLWLSTWFLSLSNKDQIFSPPDSVLSVPTVEILWRSYTVRMMNCKWWRVPRVKQVKQRIWVDILPSNNLLTRLSLASSFGVWPNSEQITEEKAHRMEKNIFYTKSAYLLTMTVG